MFSCFFFIDHNTPTLTAQPVVNLRKFFYFCYITIDSSRLFIVRHSMIQCDVFIFSIKFKLILIDLVIWTLTNHQHPWWLNSLELFLVCGELLCLVFVACDRIKDHLTESKINREKSGRQSSNNNSNKIKNRTKFIQKIKIHFHDVDGGCGCCESIFQKCHYCRWNKKQDIK